MDLHGILQQALQQERSEGSLPDPDSLRKLALEVKDRIKAEGSCCYYHFF